LNKNRSSALCRRTKEEQGDELQIDKEISHHTRIDGRTLCSSMPGRGAAWIRRFGSVALRNESRQQRARFLAGKLDGCRAWRAAERNQQSHA
jgi:hypothetical protein